MSVFGRLSRRAVFACAAIVVLAGLAIAVARFLSQGQGILPAAPSCSLIGKKGQAEAPYPGHIGERIAYEIKLGRASIGRAEFRHVERCVFEGKTVNVMTFLTRLVRFDDLETIYSDPRSFLPVKVERQIKLWPNEERIIERYDQRAFHLSVTKYRGKKQEEMAIRKDGVIHNAILLPYSVRYLPSLEVGWTLQVRLPTQEFLMKLTSIEDVTVPSGTFRAYHFESEPKKIEIWITADERRIPVKLTGSGSLGYTMLMREYSLPEAGSAPSPR